MATIEVDPLVLTDYVLTIDADSYQKAVESVQFTPRTSSISFQGGTPSASFTSQTPATWTCDLGYVQDWETTDSLSQYLLANEGATKTATFKPRTGSGPSFTATITITPGAIGGKVGTYGTTSVSLGSTKPVLVPAS